jgi:hypothetical protein
VRASADAGAVADAVAAADACPTNTRGPWRGFKRKLSPEHRFI